MFIGNLLTRKNWLCVLREFKAAQQTLCMMMAITMTGQFPQRRQRIDSLVKETANAPTTGNH
jgi:hypothetical protein